MIWSITWRTPRGRADIAAIAERVRALRKTHEKAPGARCKGARCSIL